VKENITQLQKLGDFLNWKHYYRSQVIDHYEWDPEWTNSRIWQKLATISTSNSDSNWPSAFMKRGFEKGKHFWEIVFTIDSNNTTHPFYMVGVSRRRKEMLTTMIGYTSDSWGYYNNQTHHVQKGHQTLQYAKGASYPCKVGIFLDMDEKKLHYFFNDIYCGVAFTGIEGLVYPAVSLAVGARATIYRGKWPDKSAFEKEPVTDITGSKFKDHDHFLSLYSSQIVKYKGSLAKPENQEH